MAPPAWPDASVTKSPKKDSTAGQGEIRQVARPKLVTMSRVKPKSKPLFLCAYVRGLYVSLIPGTFFSTAEASTNYLVSRSGREKKKWEK